MKKVTIFICFLLLSGSVLAQLSAPNVEDIYGGRINTIAGYNFGSDSSRIFISTESANSGYYATSYNAMGTVKVTRFKVLPSMNDAANLGSGIQMMYAHQASEKLFFINGPNLYSTDIAAASVTLFVNNVNCFLIHGDYLYYLSGNQLHFGTLNSSGLFTESTQSPVTVSGIMAKSLMQVDPANLLLYIFAEGSSPVVVRSSDVYTSFTSATTFSTLSITGLVAANTWAGFGISPSGRLFLGGSGTSGKTIAYSDDDVTFTSFNMGINGSHTSRFAFSGSGATASVYFAAVYSNAHGDFGSWHNFGDPGGVETHPNDGVTFQDPAFANMCYMTTDQGIGASRDYGASIFEIDRGIEAVQVNDFDMTSDKNTAWLASKAGIRKVSNYTTTPIWTRALWPNFDGSPYYSAEMIPEDTNIVYVGNVRVKKTTNSGVSWSEVFTAESAPYNLSSISFIDAIEVCDYDHATVFAGYNDQQGGAGGLFYSTNSGTNWDQILVSATAYGQDINVTDIIFNLEGTDTVAYVSAAYPNGYSVYRLTKSGSTWTVAKDMTAAHTSTGTSIIVTINDLCKNATGDTVYATGTDGGTNHPVVYYKPINTTNKWTPVTPTGFPFAYGKQGKAVSVGGGMVYAAVDNEIYCWVPGFPNWTLGYTYPVGTQINVMYYDDLLVGTGTGLYGHTATTPSPQFVLTTTVLTEGMWNGTSSVQDTFAVELRHSSAPYNIVSVAQGVCSNTGVIALPFNDLANGASYYVVIKHRNSIDTWSATPINFSSYEAAYNFTSSAAQAYGSNLKLVRGKYCLFSGDVTRDGFIDFSDLTAIDNDSYYFLNGYYPTDLNNDLFVDMTDLLLCDNNAFNFVSVKSPLNGDKALSGISDKTQTKAFKLNQNYPNPFNPSTRISFSLPKDGRVTLKIYSITGSEITTLTNGDMPAGTHLINFDGAHLSSGVYMYALSYNGKVLTGKMILAK
ncbi:MAG: T9SS type A sorting domain-containing protein [Ignavibacteriales bacterium]|nr:T9SS type A sorting domain-containing protein [Ignavibacteriales bacterium]